MSEAPRHALQTRTSLRPHTADLDVESGGADGRTKVACTSAPFPANASNPFAWAAAPITVTVRVAVPEGTL